MCCVPACVLFCNAMNLPGGQGFSEEMRLGSAITDDGEEAGHDQMRGRACEVSEGAGMAMKAGCGGGGCSPGVGFEGSGCSALEVTLILQKEGSVPGPRVLEGRERIPSLLLQNLCSTRPQR